jgi:hypothetical protein
VSAEACGRSGSLRGARLRRWLLYSGQAGPRDRGGDAAYLDNLYSPMKGVQGRRVRVRGANSLGIAGVERGELGAVEGRARTLLSSARALGARKSQRSPTKRQAR